MEVPALDADYVDLTAVQGELEVGPPSPYIASPTSGQAELAVALAANPAVTAALSRDPSLGATAAACLAAAKAAGTVQGYSGTLRRYNAFCFLAGLEPLSFTEDLSRVFPLRDKVGLAEAAHMRTAFRLVVEYHTLCRLACFRQLRACHFELAGDDIVVTFPSAKNDQLHLGRSSCLVASGSDFCPVRITKLYFQRFGLHFGLAAGESPLLTSASGERPLGFCRSGTSC
jgi:hypothetical protein